MILLGSVTWHLQGQVTGAHGSSLLFHGIVMDRKDESPLPGAMIFINRSFASACDAGGKFAFYAGRKDTVIFRLLGFKPVTITLSDTLQGKEFIAGIYMTSDTIAIEEVVILPRLSGLKSELLGKTMAKDRLDQNAANNLALSSYVARMSQNKMGDPAVNYDVLKQRQKESIFTRGQISDDRIVGISPLLLIPVAYALMHGMPQPPPPFRQELSDQELTDIHKRYTEGLKTKTDSLSQHGKHTNN